MNEFEYQGVDLQYNPLTGEMFRKLQTGKWKQVKAGTRNDEYSTIGINGSKVYKHRIIGEAFLGLKPDEYIDHIEHVNGTDYQDRLSNLRIVTKSQNNQNIRTAKNNTSGFKGVCFIVRDGKFRSAISINNKRYSLGYYTTPEEAFLAYLRASKQLHTGYQCIDSDQVYRAYHAVPMNDWEMIAAKVDLILENKGLI